MSFRSKPKWLTKQSSNASNSRLADSNNGSCADLQNLFSGTEPNILVEGSLKNVPVVTGSPSAKSVIATESLLGLKMLHSHSGVSIGPTGNIEPSYPQQLEVKPDQLDSVKNRLKKSGLGSTSNTSLSRPNYNGAQNTEAPIFGTSPTGVSAILGATETHPVVDILHHSAEQLAVFTFDDSEIDKRNFVLDWVRRVLQINTEVEQQFPAAQNSDTASLVETWSDLAHGTLSCVLINVLNRNSTLAPMNPNKSAVGGLDNLNQFIAEAKKYVAPETLPVFAPLDVVHNTPKGRFDFIRCLLFVALISVQKEDVAGISESQIREFLMSMTNGAWPGFVENSRATALHRVHSTASAKPKQSTSETPDTRLPRKNTYSAKTPSKLGETYVNSTSNPRNNSISANEDLLQKPQEPTEETATVSVAPTNNIELSGSWNAVFERLDIISKVQTAKIDQLAEKVLVALSGISSRLQNLETKQHDLLSSVNSLTRQMHQSQNSFTSAGFHSRAASAIQSPSSPLKLKFGSEQNIDALTDNKPSVIVAGPAPKVFGRLPKEVEDLNLPVKEKKRQTAIYELIDSEEGFLEDLQLMVTLHKVEYVKASIVSEDESSKLFCNAEEVLQASEAFVKKLKEIAEKTPCIENVGEALTEAAETFREPYVRYCAKYGDAMKYYKQIAQREDVKQVTIAIKMNPASRGLTLEGFLIKPVQRICKYPLLIREILKATELEHSSYESLKAASAKLDEVVAVVNEEIRTFENQEKLLKLQSKLEGSQLDLSSKKLILDGNLQRVYTSAVKDRYLALLEDSLLILKTAVMNKQRYTLEHGINLHDLVLTDLGARTKTFALSLTGEQQRKEPLTFMCVNQEDQIRWVETLGDAIRKHNEKRREKALNNNGTIKGTLMNYNDTESIADSTISGNQGGDDDDQSDRLSVRTDRKINGGGHRLKARPSLIYRQGSVTANLNTVGDGSANTPTASQSNLDSSANSNFPVANGSVANRGFLGLRRKQSQLKKADNADESNGTIKGHFRRISQRDNLGSGAELDEDLEQEEYQHQDVPKEVTLQGQVWRRSANAVGDIYWYNTTTKQSVWTLPEEAFTATAGPDGIDKDENTDASLVDFEPEEGVTVSLIENRREWVKIVRETENLTYFFNVSTLETVWSLPSI